MTDAPPPRPPAKSMGLAVKITLPFVALFAVLLLSLGIVLAREILTEVESQVENKQSFVLEVCSYRNFAFEEDRLREIRDLAIGESGAAVGDIVVIEDGGRKLTTLDRNNAHSQQILDDLDAAIKAQPELASADATVQRSRLKLDAKDWLVLYTSRSLRSAKQVPRHFYLIYPFDQIEQAKNSALTRIIALGGAGLLLAAALGLALAQWISRPVRRLASAAQRISAGGLNEVLDPALAADKRHSGDEIGDLTEAFQRMVESLRKSQSELLKAERLAVTGKLAASVAHEIRNPLTSLRMTVEMLQQRAVKADPATQEAHRIILSEIDRLALAVEELLTVARPRPPQRQPTDLNKLVSDTLKFMDRQLAHAKVKGAMQLDAQLPADLPLDPNKIRQLLVNLLLNAQQAIVRDGTITVRTHWDGSASAATISVQDTGPGVSEEVKTRLFELFVTTKTGGGGLGLAIAKQIVEEHGGVIGFDSSPKGTTFNVTLPAAPPPPKSTVAA